MFRETDTIMHHTKI